MPRAAKAALFFHILLLFGCDGDFDVSRHDKSVVRVQHSLLLNGKTIPGGHGTGFVLNDDGYVVTNHHVVDIVNNLPPGVRSGGFFVPDGSWKRKLRATPVWSSKKLDLAIIKVEGLGRPPVQLALVSADKSPERGETVYAIGFPGAGDATGTEAALVSTLTIGAVSKVVQGRGRPNGALRKIVQHSADINQGNSGGPLFNRCGQVIAVNTFSATSTFKLVRRPDGRIFARGSAVSGVYYSPHISSLLKALNSTSKLKDIRYHTVSKVCSPVSSNQVLYIAVASVGALAVISLLLALFRRRRPAEVVKVVESYSKWLRRHPSKRPQNPTQQKTARLENLEPDEGWRFHGMDSEGKLVSFVVGDEELTKASRRSEKGVLIGRSQAMCDKVLADGTVSRRHARLSLVSGKIGIEDLHSTYGTHVGGETLQAYTAHALENGDEIRIGDVKLTLNRL